jgi:hypothetical protein
VRIHPIVASFRTVCQASALFCSYLTALSPSHPVGSSGRRAADVQLNPCNGGRSEVSAFIGVAGPNTETHTHTYTAKSLVSFAHTSQAGQDLFTMHKGFHLHARHK